ncbi:MAG: dipeptidase PepV [Clostridia bacterium]|nr:dipeptidase PepV [Clostridia bacterium]
MKKIEELLKSYQDEMVETLQKWVRIPSVKSDEAPGAPFGVENKLALDTAMADCARMGFVTKNFDGYAGHAEMGEGEDYDALAVLAHLDVVPVVDGWTKEPFGGEVSDGKIYGRGTSDDKGPAVAALYAMRAVKEAGIPLKRKVRLILGCDEECGSSDMAYYKAHTTMPRCGFSPDAEYPVINIEKGGCHLMIAGKQAGLKVLEMNVGERANVVPGFATALVEGGEEMVQKVNEKNWPYPVTAKMENGAVRIDTVGITGHAAMPEHGRNAIGQMLLVLKELGAKGIVETLADKIGMTCYAENLGIAMEDKVSGKLTCSLDIIRTEGDDISAIMDIRYPVLFNLETAFTLLRTSLPQCRVEDAGSRKPHFVSEDTELVQELLNAYHEVTGLEKKAFAIGGGTYAQSMEEGVAFGAMFPGEEEMAHQADEYIPVEDFYKDMKIFAYSIVRLAGDIAL